MTAPVESRPAADWRALVLAGLCGAAVPLLLCRPLRDALPGETVLAWSPFAVLLTAALFSGAAVQFHASQRAPETRQSEAALYVPWALIAGAAPSAGLLALLGEDHSSLWWLSVLQVGLAFVTSALLGGVRRWRRADATGAARTPGQPASTAFVVAGLVVVVVATVTALAVTNRLQDALLGRLVFLPALLLPVAGLTLVYAVAGIGQRLHRWWRLALAATAAVPVTALIAADALKPLPVEWELAGVGSGSRVLAAVAWSGDRCGELEGEEVRRDATKVVVRVQLRPGPCRPVVYGEDGRVQIVLARPLDGQRITGPGMERIAMSQLRRVGRKLPADQATPSRRRELRVVMPRLVGLHPGDASALIGSGPRAVGAVTWTGAGRGGRVVTAQSPAPSSSIGPPLTRASGPWQADRVPIQLTTSR